MLKKYIFFALLLSILASCEEEYTPKPRGFYRIDLPEKAYKQFDSDCPYTFEYPNYAVVERYKRQDEINCWNNVVYPQFNGQLYLSYFELNDTNLVKHIADSRALTNKHIVKADAIKEIPFVHPDKRVFGLYYRIKGNAASQVQFYLTDSTDHFMRGALYFNCAPNNDSILPVLDFVADDITHMLETFEWKQSVPSRPVHQ